MHSLTRQEKNLWERKTFLELIFFDEENILTLKMFSRKLENLVECKEFDYQDYVKFRQNYNLSCDVSHPICTFFSLSGDQNKISSQ